MIFLHNLMSIFIIIKKNANVESEEEFEESIKQVKREIHMDMVVVS